MAALILAGALLGACAEMGRQGTAQGTGSDIGNGQQAVLCVLPAQVRKLGQNFTTAAPSQRAVMSARECRIRGGERLS